MRIPLITSCFKRLERLLRIDLRYALTGGFFLSATQVTSAGVGLALTVAFANLLPIETYGTYRYVLAVYGLFTILALPGMDTAVLQAVSNGKDGTFIEGLKAKLKWSLLGSFAALLYAGYEFSQGSMVTGSIFTIAGLALPLMEAFALFTSFLNGKKLFPVWAAAEISTQIVSAATIITTMFFTKNIVMLVLAYFIPYILCRIVATLYVRRYRQNNELDAGIFKYGRSLTFFQVITRAIGSIDQIVLYHFLGPAQVAIYSLATAVPNRVQSVFRITGSLAFPKFANRDPQEIARSLPRKMLIFVLGILVVCAVYILLAPLMFSIVFPKYLPSLAFSQVAIFYTLSSITYPFGSYLFAHKKVKDNYILAVSSFIVKILCLVTFVPLLGIWGAIIGLLATATVTIVLVSWMLWRDARTPASSGSV